METVGPFHGSRMTLTLRCMRCGDLDDMDPLWGWALCARCFYSRPRLRSVHVYRRWLRWQKGQERHPTHKALTAALDALESAPHGTFVENTQ
jgi:hypothetical protein